MAQSNFYRKNRDFNVIELRDDNTVLYKQNRKFHTSSFDDKSAAITFIRSLENDFAKDNYVILSAKVSPLPEAFASLEELNAYFELLIKSEAISEVLDFLKKIPKSMLTGFRASLKKFHKKYSEFAETGKNSWSTIGTNLQLDMISLTALGVITKTESKSWTSIFFLLNDSQFSYVLDVVQYVKPAWLMDYVRDRSLKEQWSSIDYSILRHLESEGLLVFDAAVFAHAISRINFWHVESVEGEQYLFDDQLSYSRDVPLLFEYPSDIQNYNLNFSKGIKPQKAWIAVFKMLVAQEKMTRDLVLEKTMEIQLKSWNNNQLSFFRELFEELKPSIPELLQLQQKFFLMIPAANKTVSGFAVRNIKKIAFESRFERAEFIEWSSNILGNYNAKTSVVVILSIFEKYAKLHSDLIPEMLLKVADTFLINDSAIQQKAAGLMVKYANKEQQELVDTLHQYRSQMFGNLSEQLAFLFADIEENGHFDGNDSNSDHLNESNLVYQPLKPIKDSNDLVYAIGQAANSDNPVDTEIVINALLENRKLLPDDYQNKLQIYLKPLQSTWKGYAGYYDQSLLIYMIFNKTHPKIELTHLDASNRLMHIRRYLAVYAYQNYFRQYNLPLLSAPTHQPCLIQANTLLRRVIAFKLKGLKLNPYDLMIAMNRMIREFDSETAVLMDQLPVNLKGLFQILVDTDEQRAYDSAISLLKSSRTSVINMLFKKVLSRVPSNKISDKTVTKLFDHLYITDSSFFSAVLMAARLRFPSREFPGFENSEYGNLPFAFENFEPEFKVQSVTYSYREYNSRNWIDEVKEGLFAKYPSTSMQPYFYYSQNIKPVKTKFNEYFSYFYESENTTLYDLRTHFGLMPYFVEPVFASLFTSEYQKPSRFSETTSGEILKSMLHPNFRFGYFSMWYIACSQFADKKEIRLLSTEILLHHISKNSIAIDDFTQKIAILYNGKYASVQRIIENLAMLRDMGERQNEALSAIIQMLLTEFAKASKVPVNTKKLLEILYDVKVKTKSRITEGTSAAIQKWTTNATLKNMTENLLNL